MNVQETMSAYDYAFPPELIATAPAHPRDSARLLIYDRTTGKTICDTFRTITDYLPNNAVLVLNDTKVMPARMHLTKETGGRVDALYLATEEGTIRALVGGHIQPGDILQWEDDHTFTVQTREEKEAMLTPSFPIDQLPALLERFGETPLPPYIKHSPLTEPERRREYQTVYAKENGSVAAPTAGLHFTEELLQKITDHGCTIQRVTLHVNLGTFAPLTEDHLRTRTLHEEWYAIDPETAQFLINAKRKGRPIIAVGTTVVRTLESAFRNVMVSLPNHDTPNTPSLSGSTTLFLSPDNPPHFVDGLITNFHVPKSSLLMLVAAFTGRKKLLDLYHQAIAQKFRLFSFGDGMMVTAAPSADPRARRL